MSNTALFFICPTCFTASKEDCFCHGHQMIECPQLDAADYRRKPPFDASGRLRSRAPIWFLQAVQPGRFDRAY